MATATKPVRVFRSRGISASVFANPRNDGKGTFYKVNLQRAFKVQGRFDHNSSFGRDDIPMACTVLQRAYEFILDTETLKSKGSEESTE